MVPLLQDKPLFIPDLPGYGLSAPADKHDKVNIGLLLIKALSETVGDVDYQPIVLVGHDRGARVAHALHVFLGNDEVNGFNIIGLSLLDIVPTLAQWQVGDSAAAQVGYFHWSFLANVSLAIPMLAAYGGGRWATDMINRWAGTNAEGLEKLKSGNALEVYRDFFDQESIIEASCRDYEAGAFADVDAETEAINSKRLISVPLLLIYSQAFLPKRAKVPIAEVWGLPWSGPGLITDNPIGNGIGHFVAEEEPQATADALLKWLSKL